MVNQMEEEVWLEAQGFGRYLRGEEGCVFETPLGALRNRGKKNGSRIFEQNVAWGSPILFGQEVDRSLLFACGTRPLMPRNERGVIEVRGRSKSGSRDAIICPSDCLLRFSKTRR